MTNYIRSYYNTTVILELKFKLSSTLKKSKDEAS